LKHKHIVIGADTIVVCDGDILGKPEDEEEAKSMLMKLSGRYHHVITGLSIVKSTSEILHVENVKYGQVQITNHMKLKNMLIPKAFG
jgi:predicted house-cleaning NTP pyrophosphatase (Maf/HAM1 superfamily)